MTSDADTGRRGKESGAEFVQPLVSVIVPCRNEQKWIDQCLQSILANDYPADRLEVLVIDGMSDDGTREAVRPFVAQYTSVKLLDNPKKTTPVALNVGIAAARGEIIMRMDAHYKYPPDYMSRLVSWLEKSGADNVGGCLIMGPAAETAVARAIAIGVTHPFGIGNAYYRIGTSEPRWVDTVPFGCYRKTVFQRIGVFDEELVRNQDIELNRRLRRAGGKILLVPDVVLYGHARDSLSKLWRMYYQYGYFNPLVIKKSGGRVTLRQTATPAFVVSLLVCGLAAIWFPPAAWMLVAIAVAYMVPVLIASAAVARKHGIRCGLAMCAVFPALHLSHGLGCLKGLIDWIVLRRNMKDRGAAVPLTR